ncbi:sensor histidine kinase [Frigoribacterium salinisoli]
MLLGLPAHLAAQSTARALTRACHGIAAVLLVSVAVVVAMIQAATPSLLLWPALLAVLLLGLLLALVERTRTTVATVAYLAVGGAALYLYAVTLLTQVSVVESSDAFTLTLPKIALVMVGGSGSRGRHALRWATSGFVVGELVTQLATWQTGGEAQLDVATLLAFALVAGTTLHAEVVRDRVRREQPVLHRAAQDEALSALRWDLEQEAAAHVHDTVLNHLAAVRAAGPGPLRPELAAAITTDLDDLVGGDWLEAGVAGGPSSRPPSVASPTSTPPPFDAAVERVVAAGLDVRVTGEVGLVGTLDPVRAEALAGAVGQCLTNVLRHAGTGRAEIVAYGDEREVTVMVIDDGVGFDPATVDEGRLGLSGSVVGRLARVGGQAQVWSAPGAGTSVVLCVPTGRGDDGGDR